MHGAHGGQSQNVNRLHIEILTEMPQQLGAGRTIAATFKSSTSRLYLLVESTRHAAASTAMHGDSDAALLLMLTPFITSLQP